MKKIVILWLIFLQPVIGTVNNSSCLLEKNRNELYTIIEKMVPGEMIEGKQVNHYTQTPIIKLTFLESSALWLLAQKNHKKYTNEERMALERMYKLCGNATIAEHVLLILIGLYIEKKTYQSAAEILNVFNKLFPGSYFYKETRILHIQVLFELCYTYEYDLENIKDALLQCQLYFKDFGDDKEKNDANFISVCVIAQNLYLEIIKQYKAIICHYLTKYSYTWNSICLYACLQRLEGIVGLTNEALAVPAVDTVQNSEFEKNMKGIAEVINNFFIDNALALPKGKNFLEDREVFEKKIYDDGGIIKTNIKKIINAILI